MHREEVLARLEDVESACRRLRSCLEEPEPTVLYETAEEFAGRRGVSVYTVRRWCKQGMPHSFPGHYRIPVREAEQWRESNGRVVSIQQSARRAAWGER